MRLKPIILDKILKMILKYISFFRLALILFKTLLNVLVQYAIIILF